MVYEFVFVFIVLNIIYELVEILLPVQKMKLIVKSFTLVVLLYAMCEYLFLLI